MRVAVLCLLIAGCDLVFELNEPKKPESCTKPDLKLCLAFEDNLGDRVATDESDNLNDAMLTDVVFVTRDGQGAVMLGPGSLIEVLTVNTLDLPGPFSFDGFLNWAGTGPTTQSIVDNFLQYGITVNTSGLGFSCTVIFTDPPFTASIAIAGGLSVGEWHHVACVFDANGASIYVNGGLAGNSPTIGTVRVEENRRVRVGSFSDETAKFEGQIDNVRIFDRALTADEILAAANGM